MLGRVARSLALVGLLTFTASTAGAVTLSVVSGGLTNINQNYACAAGAALCPFPPAIFLENEVSATGTFTIDAALTSATVLLHLDLFRFDHYDPSPDGVTFSDVTYSAVIPIAVYGGTVFQAGIGTGTITGNANGSPFSVVNPQITNLTCSSLTQAGQCGIQFGENGYTLLGYDFVNTFNVLVTPALVPEPALTLLVLAGLAGLVARARA